MTRLRAILHRSTSTALLAVPAASLLLGACDASHTTRPLTVDGLRAASNSTIAVSTAQPVPAQVSLTVGDSATVSVNLNALPNSRARRIPELLGVSSSDPSVATVTRVGAQARVKAIGAGTASLILTLSDGESRGRITVIAAPTPPTNNASPAPTLIASLSAMRFDAQAGTVVISNGVPLRPGALSPSDVGSLRLFVDGTEVSAYVEGLAGRHPDGSLRSVLVQASIALGLTPIAVELRIGGTPATRRAAVPRSAIPAAAFLPTDPAYLIATNVAGFGLRAMRTGNDIMSIHDQDYRVIEEADWSRCGPQQSCGGRIAGYERALTSFQYWVRTGDPVLWYRAVQQAENYRRTNDFTNWTVPWWTQTEQLATHYFLTGDTVSRVAVRGLAQSMADQTRGLPFSTDNSYSIASGRGDDRGSAKALTSMIDAYNVGYADVPNYCCYSRIVTEQMTRNLNDVLAGQAASGAFGGYEYAGGQKNFMVGMLMTALAKHYDEVSADPRILVAIKKGIDYMWATQWDGAVQGFKYVSVYASPGNDPTPFPALNNLCMHSMGWYMARTGDNSYAAALQAGYAGVRLGRGNWYTYSQEFDQAYAHFGQLKY